MTVGAWTSRHLSSTTLTLQMEIHQRRKPIASALLGTRQATVGVDALDETAARRLVVHRALSPRKLVEPCLNVCAEPHAFLVVSTDLTEPFWHALPYSTAADRFGSAWARQD
jgi:hypothetical protein